MIQAVAGKRELSLPQHAFRGHRLCWTLAWCFGDTAFLGLCPVGRGIVMPNPGDSGSAPAQLERGPTACSADRPLPRFPGWMSAPLSHRGSGRWAGARGPLLNAREP